MDIPKPSRMAPLRTDFIAKMERQPYDVDLDGLHLTVGKDVFMPDFGLSARNLAIYAADYKPARALEIGCGSGYIALQMKWNGAGEVWAADIHGPAVECTRKNVEQNPQAGPVTVVQSDLFGNIPAGEKFDLILFNQPYGPGDERRVCGCGEDGGYDICKRFMLTAPPYMNEGAVLLMSFSDRAPAEHDPKAVAEELGYRVTTLLHAFYGNANNFIYEIRLPAV